MKIERVSLNQTSFQNTTSKNTLNPYLYMPKNVNNEDKFTFKNHKLEYLGGFCAACLAFICLTKFTVNKALPKSIIEIADQTKGLNGIENTKAVKLLKEKVLYPLKSVDMGQENLLRESHFKTGIIIRSNDISKAQNLKQAFIEHCEALGFKIFRSLDEKQTHKVTTAKTNTHRVLNKANNMFYENQVISIADIDELNKITNLKPNKIKSASKLEKKLIDQEPGVLWIAYTDKVNDIPYFYNNPRTLFVTID